MLKAALGALCVAGIGRVIAYRRVVVGLTLPGLSLHDAHGPPFDETISSTPYGAHASLRLSDAPRPLSRSRLLGGSLSGERGSSADGKCGPDVHSPTGRFSRRKVSATTPSVR
jgi:hypothetical protein